jgi:hypothetical protein
MSEFDNEDSGAVLESDMLKRELGVEERGSAGREKER